MRVLSLGNCINWQFVETDDDNYALRCSSTGKIIPMEHDAEGGLLLPEGVTFVEETTAPTTATSATA